MLPDPDKREEFVDWDFEFRTDQFAQDKASLLHAVRLGKMGFWIGLGSSLVGEVLVIIGLTLAGNLTGSLHRIWFILALIICLVVVGVQGALLWELKDGRNRHPEKLVKRCRIAYEVVAIGGFVTLFLVTAVGTFRESFYATEGDATPATVVMILSLFVYFFGIGASILIYRKYASLIGEVRTHTAQPPVDNPARQLKRKASDVARKAGGSLRTIRRNASRASSRSAASRSKEFERDGNDEDRLPQDLPLYDRKASTRAGQPLSLASSPVDSESSRQGSDSEDVAGRPTSGQSVKQTNSIRSNTATPSWKRDNELFLPDTDRFSPKDDRSTLPSQDPQRRQNSTSQPQYKAYRPPPPSKPSINPSTIPASLRVAAPPARSSPPSRSAASAPLSKPAYPPLAAPPRISSSSPSNKPTATPSSPLLPPSQALRSTQGKQRVSSIATAYRNGVSSTKKRRPKDEPEDETYYSDSESGSGTDDDERIDKTLQRRYSGNLGRVRIANPSSPL
ncbi:uncharacterized protein JCM6883_006832 [Sporobolomyces salmoneus]|uniref:uncharacterized protein n=1 Tax=Sporobolomyces salmoneus TaxID=183962 RepID=UPI003181C911